MGKPVGVLTEFPPGNRLPAVTMNSIGGRGHIETLVFKNMNPLPYEHPYFDLQAPKTLYNTREEIKHVFGGKILLHVWSETNEERDMLTEEIISKIMKNKNDDYSPELHVHLHGIGAITDLDQFDSFPPLYHTTIELDFIYTFTETKKVQPLCKLTN